MFTKSLYIKVYSIHYLLGGTVVFTNNRLTRILFDGGYISNDYAWNTCNARPNDFLWPEEEDSLDMAKEYPFGVVDDDETELRFMFYNKDHLGNNRMVIDSEGNVLQRTDYYPYGTPFYEPSTVNNSALQQYKYNGKELDVMHGLNTYDYGARQYNPITARWDRMDPLAEKYYSVSPYVYCLNNPIRLIDPDGKAPGDRFKYPTLAAIDFGITYNVESIKRNMEMASFIYKMKDKDGIIYYTYPGPAKGSKDHVSKEDMKSIDRSQIPFDEVIEVVATIHTHGQEIEGYENNKFSGEQTTPKQNKEWRGVKQRGNRNNPDDISEANRTQTYSYVVTPNGELRGYDPKTGKVMVWSTKMPTSDKQVNNTEKKDSNSSIWERFIRFIKSF